MNKRSRRKHLKRKWRITLIVFICCLITALLSPGKTKITLKGDNPQYTEYGQNYTDPGAEAYIYPVLLPFLHKTVNFTVSGTVDTHKLYTTVLTYTSSNASVERKVIVRDTTPPIITLTHNTDAYTLPGHPYEEEGYTAQDNLDGDITAEVQTKEENGIVRYTVSDSSGNKTEVERKIIYDDRTPPTISLNGGNAIIWYTDEGPYQDSYQAEDDLDGDVTTAVSIEGTVDSSVPGDYILTYTVHDSYNNTSTIQRTVHVENRPANTSGLPESANTIYLTFDDGPGPFTSQLLDILAEYNVKASFFTTSARPQYAGEIAREAAEGHTVAVHTCSHNYAAVYASTEAYWQDFNAQNAVVKAQTGSYTTMFRFPGGSSNTVSRDYCPGIMTTLVSEADQNGYTYFDWNVSSGDAGGTTDTDQVYNNVITQISRCHAAGMPSVVLQHDVKDFSVNAVERIIQWGLANGYNFQPLSPSSYTAHHGLNN